ncbi:MAG: GNAT family N-acetyltransferase [Proteobacteria bacterium]|nr:GNAT family N-acetyltransferase [Desulfobacula sp.]MBU3952350.1 GNAT family N-acetyltransferase [Pseudomonadota bacterium]MBU4132222.1 GNAT family N-acetyltransferase [Pseudomonadota bacterium]
MDKPNIHLAGPDDKNAWDHYVLRHPHGIAYQLYGFKQAIGAAYGFETVYFMAKIQNRVQGILPLVHVRLPGRPGMLVSLPYCDAGGLLADSAEIEIQLLHHGVAYSRERQIPRLCIRSVHSFAKIDSNLTHNPEKARMLLRLPPSSELLFSSLRAKVRSQVKKPIRDGLTFRIGGKELVSALYPVFCENMRDLGSLVHSQKWLQGILGAYKNRAHIGIVRMPDKRPVAAGIILCHPRVVSIPWASSLRRFNQFNPNMLLYWEFLKFTAANRYPVFDFGRSTPGEGSFHFKKQWGSEPQFLHWADFDTRQEMGTPVPLAKISSMPFASHRDILETLLSRTPVGVTTLLGRYARKFISL